MNNDNTMQCRAILHVNDIDGRIYFVPPKVWSANKWLALHKYNRVYILEQYLNFCVIKLKFFKALSWNLLCYVDFVQVYLFKVI